MLWAKKSGEGFSEYIELKLSKTDREVGYFKAGKKNLTLRRCTTKSNWELFDRKSHYESSYLQTMCWTAVTTPHRTGRGPLLFPGASSCVWVAPQCSGIEFGRGPMILDDPRSSVPGSHPQWFPCIARLSTSGHLLGTWEPTLLLPVGDLRESFSRTPISNTQGILGSMQD